MMHRDREKAPLRLFHSRLSTFHSLAGTHTPPHAHRKYITKAMDSRKGTAVAAAALDKKMPADTSSTFSSQEQTVEEYLKAHCSQLVGDLNAHAEGLIKNLQEELEKGKAEILALAQDNNALAPAAVQPPSSDSSTDASSGGAATSYSHPRPAEAAAAAASAPPTVPAYQTIILHVKEGPYASCTFKLIQSKARKEFIIGRSTGKKVKDHGVSLPQDPEVSTVHGRVEVRGNGNIVFEDLGSTNGSFINSISLEERVPQVLRTDDVLKCGGTIMTVELQQQGEAQ